MPRYRLTVEYDGGPYCGWQRQENAPSVQQALEEALAKFLGEAPRLTCAGRTDTGVHALGQVVHFDAERAWRTDVLRDATNAHLRPHPVSVLKAEEVASDFDARRTAIRRHYLYRILDRRSPSALDGARVWHLPFTLDEARMAEAAKSFLGQHDFTTFRAAECQASGPVRTIERVSVRRMGAEIRIEVSARSFLHHQVRSMVGSLMPIGRGFLDVNEIARLLNVRDRSQCGALAPPHGLYLVKVDYPEA
ncbi:MAG: tRNA pseudouridine(38-40) synthase TruA [Bosea sp. (in: a-proteobacteria)]